MYIHRGNYSVRVSAHAELYLFGRRLCRSARTVAVADVSVVYMHLLCHFRYERSGKVVRDTVTVLGSKHFAILG